MGILKITCSIIAAVALAIAITFVAARFRDGPLGLFPGGPLESGELVSGPVASWQFAESLETIEMQLEGDDISRTTWVLVEEDRAFIPCSLGFPPMKDWHVRANENGRAIIRIGDKRYPVDLQRISDPTLEGALARNVTSKYGAGIPSESGVWFFAIESRPN